MSEEELAQVIELREWEHNNRSRGAPVRYAPDDPGYGPEECVRCDEDMPMARRAHGFQICVSCKSHDEANERYQRSR